MHRLLSDPWVAAQIDAAVAPYRGKWTERQIEIFREKAAHMLAEHPDASRLVDRETGAGVYQSGDRLTEKGALAMKQVEEEAARRAGSVGTVSAIGGRARKGSKAG